MAELHDGGYQALLYHLLHEIDLKGLQRPCGAKDGSAGRTGGLSRKGVDLLVEMVCHDAVVPCQIGDRVGVSVCRDVTRPTWPLRRGFDWYIDHHTDRDLSRLAR